MPGENHAADPDSDPIAAAVREIQERVRARYPGSTAAPLEAPLADVTPLLRARDAAQGKVAAIGTVNPRPPGLVNGMIQAAKRLVARALDWHVREQVEFNRALMACVESTLEALDETNRAIHALSAQTAARLQELAVLGEEARQLRDIRSHWSEWRVEWERKLSVNEIQFLRSVADLQSAFQHRTSLMESNFRELVGAQHRDFTVALEKSAAEIQKRLWEDLEKIRLEYERIIHYELRSARQRVAAAPGAAPAVSAPEPDLPAIDWLHFAGLFRGSEEHVREGQRRYLDYFAGCRDVVDLGCGRGEFLELMKEAGIPACGVDRNADCVALCRRKGLTAECADLFEYLDSLPEASIDGVFCAHLIEHLPPERLPALIRLAARKLAPGGRLAIETPNPECLAIFATHFFIDPTHTRPVPPALLEFYFVECGFGRLETLRFAPAIDSIPSLAGLPEDLRRTLFGGLDYAILARRL